MSFVIFVAKIGEYKPVPVDDLAHRRGNTMTEHRSRAREGVELTVLAAGIHAGGQIGQQRGIEGAAGKRSVDRTGIDAGDARLVRLCRTACMATRSKASFVVVSNPATAPGCCWLSTCSIQAESLPVDQLTRIFMTRRD